MPSEKGFYLLVADTLPECLEHLVFVSILLIRYALDKMSTRTSPVSCVVVLNYGCCKKTVMDLLPLVKPVSANYTSIVQKVT